MATDNSSKAISVRIPMTDYVKFLTEASDNKLSMSEFFTMKLYSASQTKLMEVSSIEAINTLKTQIKKLKLENKAHAKENKALRTSASEFHKAWKQQQLEKKKLSDELALLKSKSKTDTNIDESKKKLNELQLKYDALNKEFKQNKRHK